MLKVHALMQHSNNMLEKHQEEEERKGVSYHEHAMREYDFVSANDGRKFRKLVYSASNIPALFFLADRKTITPEIVVPISGTKCSR